MNAHTFALPDQTCKWRDWHVPLQYDSFTVREVLDSMKHIKASQDDIPLIVQLVENPRYDIPGFNLFNGAVSIGDHDFIHALLGRGLLPKDEAFVVGFTMGSTNRVSSFEQNLYSFVSKYLYPGPYKFKDDDLQVFKDAACLGYVSDCTPLDTVEYAKLLDLSLKQAREKIGIETTLIQAYFEIEKKRHPGIKESQRL